MENSNWQILRRDLDSQPKLRALRNWWSVENMEVEDKGDRSWTCQRKKVILCHTLRWMWTVQSQKLQMRLKMLLFPVEVAEVFTGSLQYPACWDGNFYDWKCRGIAQGERSFFFWEAWLIAESLGTTVICLQKASPQHTVRFLPS